MKKTKNSKNTTKNFWTDKKRIADIIFGIILVIVIVIFIKIIFVGNDKKDNNKKSSYSYSIPESNYAGDSSFNLDESL